jgi:hypothetical protein
MAGDGLAPAEIRELINRFGSLDKAVQAAKERPGFADELRRAETSSWWAALGRSSQTSAEANEYFWKLVYAAVGDEAAPTVGHRGSSRGRSNKAVSKEEANKAARIYAEDRTRTPYAVHLLYKRRIENGPSATRYDARTGLHLGRPMVALLIDAIDRDWLRWDDVENELGISDEFLTSGGKFEIPRRKPARQAEI